MREQICEMCESRPANCGLIDIVNQETIFLCYHCSEKLEDIHERVWGHVVRCKDCKYKVTTEDGEWNPEDIVCDYWASDGLEANDFCSRGEKK